MRAWSAPSTAPASAEAAWAAYAELASGHELVVCEGADSARVRLALTPQGRALRGAAEPVPARVLQSTECALPELVALTAQLQRLRDQLGAAALPGAEPG